MKKSIRYSKAASERRQLWFERHRRLPTRLLGPDEELLYALVHRSVRPTLPTPVASHRLTADLAWRVAFDRAAVLITVRGRVAASLEPLVLVRDCGNLERDDFLRCDAKDFLRRRNTLLAALAEGEQQRVLVQYHNLLLAQLGPVPPQGAGRPAEMHRPQAGPAASELMVAEDPGDAEDEPGEPAISLEEDEVPLSPAAPTKPGAPVTETSDPALTSEQSGRAGTHTGLVRRIAKRVIHLVGNKTLSFSELRSVGHEALVEAAKRYNPARPTSFATYARYRVFGAMIDAVRKHSRGVGRYEVPLAYLGQAPGPSPEGALIAADERRRLSVLVEALEPQEQALLEALYTDERTMTEIAGEVGVHPSTISRRHAQILNRLGKRLLAHERGSVPSCLVRLASDPSSVRESDAKAGSPRSESLPLSKSHRHGPT